MREAMSERSGAAVVRTMKIGMEARRRTATAEHCGRCQRGTPVTCQVIHTHDGERYLPLCGSCAHADRRRSSARPSSTRRSLSAAAMAQHHANWLRLTSREQVQRDDAQREDARLRDAEHAYASLTRH